MSDNKFTPGPWRLSMESKRIIKKDFSAIGSNDGFLIASSMGRDDSGFYASDDEADANALLIAAAPDLYEAATDALNVLDRSMDKPPSHNQIMAVLEKLSAALAKARGEI